MTNVRCLNNYDTAQYFRCEFVSFTRKRFKAKICILVVECFTRKKKQENTFTFY